MKKFDKYLDEVADFITKHLWNRVLEKRYVEYQVRRDKERQESVDKILKQAIDATERKEGSPTAIKSTSIELSRHYTSYGGIDTRVYFTDEPWLVMREKALSDPSKLPKAYSSCQAISWEIYKGTMAPVELCGHNVKGTFVDLLLDYVRYPVEGRYITVVAMSEYGKGCVVFEGRDFKILKIECGIAIDDMVTEQQITYSCEYMGAYPLHPLENVDEYVMDRIYDFDDSVEEIIDVKE